MPLRYEVRVECEGVRKGASCGRETNGMLSYEKANTLLTAHRAPSLELSLDAKEDGWRMTFKGVFCSDECEASHR
jgi:hypothetical protein